MRAALYLSLFSPVAFSVPSFASLNAKECPILGPAFVPPVSATALQAMRSIIPSFTKNLEAALANGTNSTYGPLENQTTSFSISVYSAHDNLSLYEYHYAAPGLNGSLTSGTLNNDTIYRLGSLSKLYTIYAYLIKAGVGSLEDPITKYIPELAAADAAHSADFDEVDEVKWCDITLRALASQLSGISRSYVLQDRAFGDQSVLAAAGFPSLNSSQLPVCDPISDRPCSRERKSNKKFFKGVIGRHPVTAPFNTPIYSNLAYGLLGYVIETFTSTAFDDAIQDILFRPLNLSRTFYSAPPTNTTNTIIPHRNTPEEVDFSLSIGPEGPGGNYYASLNDVATLGRAILKSTLLPRRLTRQWLKPTAHTSALDFSVGAPWEIFRVETPVSSNTTSTRIVDLYGKGGDIPPYHTIVMLSPDHDIGFTALAAGDFGGSTRGTLANMFATVLLPMVEQVARQEAAAAFEGTYADVSTNSSIVISTDPDRPALGIEKWRSNGVDMLASIAADNNVEASVLNVRLYPMGLRQGNKLSFRANFQLGDPPNVLGGCLSWLTIDDDTFGAIGTDEFVIEVDDDGNAVSVTPRALRVSLGKL